MKLGAHRFLTALPLSWLLIGCGATVQVDGTGGSGGEGECNGSNCTTPACPELPVAAEPCDLPDGTECSASGSAECAQIFRCDPVYPEAGAPSEWVYVREEGPGCEQCLADPTCDPGDLQVSECLEEVPCYTASACGTEILCEDSSLPQHGCPPEPPDGVPCAGESFFCDYDLGGGCYSSYVCDAGAWTSVGGGCDGSG